MRLILCLAAITALTGCASRGVRAPIAAAPNLRKAPYIDLQAGWRLKVITPITKSGTYRPDLKGEQTGNTITLAAGDDFIGYETAYYAVEPRGRAGVRIEFTSAEDLENGVPRAQSSPRARLFQLPHNAKYVRLLYLKRVSQTDHDMAVLASNDVTLLSALTGQVQADPSACERTKRTFCSWIPSGIAVRPELLKIPDGKQNWVPAR